MNRRRQSYSEYQLRFYRRGERWSTNVSTCDNVLRRVTSPQDLISHPLPRPDRDGQDILHRESLKGDSLERLPQVETR